MPFFYSQYLKDAKPKGQPKQSNKTTNKPTHKRTSSNTAKRPTTTARGGGSGSASRLVWHSNIGASSKTRAPANFKPLGYTDGKKVVHFSTIEVQPFHFDWSVADDVFYTRKELTAMGQARFDDAAILRQQRHNREKDEVSVDDVDIVKKSKVKDIATLLTMALDDSDQDENVSIRGIEHFVYPDLQQEMIRKKKEVQREVLGFVRAKRADPQGWRLAQHSRTFSQWARNVALEKGMKYCMNNCAGDDTGETVISDEEKEQFQRSTDELEASSRSLHGSQSFSGPASSRSYDAEDRPKTPVNVLQQISENEDDSNNNMDGGEGNEIISGGEEDIKSTIIDEISKSVGELDIVDTPEIESSHEDNHGSSEIQTSGETTGETASLPRLV